MTRTQRFIIRCIDLCVSALMLYVAAPVMLVIAVLIRRESNGAAIFKQERAGRDGIPFTMYKFRTMRFDADPFGASPHSGEDSRLTSIGRRLREKSLDELPQLLNVLTGTMSLVGPRPLYVSQMAEWNDRQRRRLEVKPGITGLAQISGRGSLAIEEKIELDVQFVEQAGVWTHLKIFIATFVHFARGQDVYEVRYSRKHETRPAGGKRL